MSNLKKILNKIFLFLALIFLVLFILTNRGYIGYLIHPLPFEGPYSGTVMDESTGKPIAGARIIGPMSIYWTQIFVLFAILFPKVAKEYISY